jgi:hypothetical protein
MRGSRFLIITFIVLTASREEKAELPLQRKGISHNHVDLPPLVSTDTTRVCIPICNSEVPFAAF